MIEIGSTLQITIDALKTRINNDATPNPEIKQLVDKLDNVVDMIYKYENIDLLTDIRTQIENLDFENLPQTIRDEVNSKINNLDNELKDFFPCYLKSDGELIPYEHEYASYYRIGKLVFFQIYLKNIHSILEDDNRPFGIDSFPFKFFGSFSSFPISYSGSCDLSSIGVSSLISLNGGTRLYCHSLSGISSPITNSQIKKIALNRIIVSGSYYTD